MSPVKKLFSTMLIALTIGVLGAPALWAAEMITGTIAEKKTGEDRVFLTITTQDGRSVNLEAAKDQAKDLQKGDNVEITAEGNKAQSIKKL